MDTPRLTEDMCQTAMRKACEAEANRGRKTKFIWTAQMDADLLYAEDELNLSRTAIARAMKKAYGWGSRNAVESRLRVLKGEA
jgi:hypothetical protein